LWIGSEGDLEGTSGDTIQMLCNLQLGMHIKRNGSVKRFYEERIPLKSVRSVRLWDNESLDANDFTDVNEIMVESGTVLIKDRIVKLGEEVKICDGLYSVSQIVQSVSKRDTRKLLKCSLTVYLS
jgi:hypothetical protein